MTATAARSVNTPPGQVSHFALCRSAFLLKGSSAAVIRLNRFQYFANLLYQFYGHPPCGRPQAPLYWTSPRTTRLLLTICVIAVFAAALTGCAAERSTILFTSDRDGNLEIYSISSTGEDEKNLTESHRDEHSPLLSQNRRMVAFLTGVSSRSALEVMRVDGSERAQIANGELLSHHRWSPAGERMAFLGTQDERKRVMVGFTDGSGSGLLTSIEAEEIGDWARNGEYVSFVLREVDGQGIYVRNPDGVNELRLTDQPDYSPRWSPSSRQIAFLSTRDGNPELYVMDC